MIAIPESAASVPMPLELHLRIPAEFAKTMSRKMALWLLLYCLVFEALFIAYDVHAGHARLTHAGVILLLSVFMFKPWLSFSSGDWIYAVNDKGIYLRNTSDVINPFGFNLFRWDTGSLLNFHRSEWRGWPALNVKFLYKGHERAKLFVFRPDDEKIVNETLTPWLITKLAPFTPDASD